MAESITESAYSRRIESRSNCVQVYYVYVSNREDFVVAAHVLLRYWSCPSKDLLIHQLRESWRGLISAPFPRKLLSLAEVEWDVIGHSSSYRITRHRGKPQDSQQFEGYCMCQILLVAVSCSLLQNSLNTTALSDGTGLCHFLSLAYKTFRTCVLWQCGVVFLRHDLFKAELCLCVTFIITHSNVYQWI
jgi:hypothetical protein